MTGLLPAGKGEPGIEGGMLRRPQPGAGTVNAIGVASIETTVPRRVFSTRNPPGIMDNYLKMRCDVFEEMRA